MWHISQVGVTSSLLVASINPLIVRLAREFCWDCGVDRYIGPYLLRYRHKSVHNEFKWTATFLDQFDNSSFSPSIDLISGRPPTHHYEQSKFSESDRWTGRGSELTLGAAVRRRTIRVRLVDTCRSLGNRPSACPVIYFLPGANYSPKPWLGYYTYGQVNRCR